MHTHTGTATATGSNGNSAMRSVTRSGGDVRSSTIGSNGDTVSRDVDRTTATTASGCQTSVTGPKGGAGSATVTH